jgi:hypothetical protein
MGQKVTGSNALLEQTILCLWHERCGTSLASGTQESSKAEYPVGPTSFCGDGMDFKNFLKPDPWKLSLFLLVFTILVPFLEYDIGLRCITTPCDTVEFGPIVSFFFRSPTFYIFNIYYPFLIPGLVLSYLVSCLIIIEVIEYRSL